MPVISALALRPLAVGALLLLLSAAEARHRLVPRFDWHSRATNLILGLSGVVAVAAVPLSTVALAARMQRLHWGLFGALDAPRLMEIIAAVVLLDLAIYLQHRAFHRVGALWRLHRVHHSATAFNATLGVRFHPLEIVLSLLYKAALVMLLGPPVTAVVLYETLLAIFSLATHAELSLPPALEQSLRRFFVTPDWHRVHHSPLRCETDSNYGNALSVWDWLFGTARDVPRRADAGARFGLDDPSLTADASFGGLLLQPLLTQTPASAPGAVTRDSRAGPRPPRCE